MLSNEKQFLRISFTSLFRFIFVIFFVYFSGNVFFLWDGFKDYASTEFLPSVAIACILFAIMAVIISLLIWLVFIALERFFLRMGWEIRIEHLSLLYTAFLILSLSLLWTLKKLAWSDVHMTPELKFAVFVSGVMISIIPTRFFYSKAGQWVGIMQKRIIPLAWLFGIMVLISIPFVGYLTWQEIQIHISVNEDSKNIRPLVTFVFDDNYEKIFTKAKPIFDAQGEVACAAITLDYINKPGRMTAKQIMELQKGGWEILSHTVTHPDLTTLSGIEIEDELRESKEGLEALGFKIDNFVYPFYRHNANVRGIARKYYRSARAGDERTTGLDINPYFLRRYALSSANLESPDQLVVLKRYVDRIREDGSWLIVTIHNVHPYREKMLNSLIDYIQKKGIEIVTINQALNLIGDRKVSKMAEFLFILNNDSPGNIFRNIHILAQNLLGMFHNKWLKVN